MCVCVRACVHVGTCMSTCVCACVVCLCACAHLCTWTYVGKNNVCVFDLQNCVILTVTHPLSSLCSCTYVHISSLQALLVCLLIRFNIGSTETLNISDIHQQVVDYYHSRYSSNLVRTAVCYCLCCFTEWCNVTSCIVKWSEGQVVALQMFLGTYC